MAYVHRLNVQAVLLRLEIEYVYQQIKLPGGKTEATSDVRSFYLYSFAKNDEIGISNRLTRRE